MIRVKVLSTIKEHVWLHQFPDNIPEWNDCLFIFDHDEKDYDWLVVYEDLPRYNGGKFSYGDENLTCTSENTILVTQEPSSIKQYGKAYTEQFGHVLTSQSNFFLPHRKRIYSQPSLQWFYGVSANNSVPYNEIKDNNYKKYDNKVSVVWSDKQQIHTEHFQRFKFLNHLNKHLSTMDIFGKGHKLLDDKADCLNPYKYHIAIENHFEQHHWTEKISDPLLGLSLPFYFGCPNLEDYFPEESFIRINIHKPNESLEIIHNAITNNAYEKRLDAIKESKKLVMTEYNLFFVLSEYISKNSFRPNHESDSEKQSIASRRVANRKNFRSFFQYLAKKYLTRSYFILINVISNLKYLIKG